MCLLLCLGKNKARVASGNAAPGDGGGFWI